MTGRTGCRARPGPVVDVEEFLDGHPGMYTPDELAAALAGSLDPMAAAGVVAYLLASGRAVLDDDERLVRPREAPEPWELP